MSNDSMLFFFGFPFGLGCSLLGFMVAGYRTRSCLSVSIMKQLFVTAGEVKHLIENSGREYIKQPKRDSFRLTSGTIKTKILIFRSFLDF